MTIVHDAVGSTVTVGPATGADAVDDTLDRANGDADADVSDVAPAPRDRYAQKILRRESRGARARAGRGNRTRLLRARALDRVGSNGADFCRR